MKKEMICIMCPLSCHLIVEQANNEIKVSGNTCPRGAKYGHDEMTHPLRVVTSTVAIQKAAIDRLPIISSKPIAKEKIFEVMEVIHHTTVEAPVKMNDIIIRNVDGSGTDMIASRTLAKKQR